MVSTVVEICNMALIRVGAAKIISLTDDSKGANLCNTYYEQTRDEICREYSWNCTLERQALAQLSEAPAFGYEYQYTLPTDPYCLRALNTDDREQDHRIEGRKLLSNANSVSLRYVKKMINPAEMDSDLAELIAIRLATKLAYSLPQSRGVRQDLFGEYMVMLEKAKSIDAEESKQDDVEEQDDGSDLWEDAR